MIIIQDKSEKLGNSGNQLVDQCPNDLFRRRPARQRRSGHLAKGGKTLNDAVSHPGQKCAWVAVIFIQRELADGKLGIVRKLN